MANTIGIDDSEFETLYFSPVCLGCKNLTNMVNTERACRAFPKEAGIPKEIWNGENPHTEPVSGDNGIQYEAGEPTEAIKALNKAAAEAEVWLKQHGTTVPA